MIDLWVVLAWAAGAGVVYLLLKALDAVPTTPTAADVLAFLTLVLPVTLTFAYQESSKRQATVGKRRLGLAVVSMTGARIDLGRSTRDRG